jgi:transcriptional regulator GlxA family with amidase domain
MNFQDTLGTTPHAYILKTRLRRAHDELLAADKDFGLTVADVAARWGFTNMGRFAEQYGRVYQEKPSDTLKATQGVRAARSPEPVKQSAAAAQTAS